MKRLLDSRGVVAKYLVTNGTIKSLKTLVDEGYPILHYMGTVCKRDDLESFRYIYSLCVGMRLHTFATLAASSGSLKILRWISTQIEINVDDCATAAVTAGQVEIILWLMERYKLDWKCYATLACKHQQISLLEILPIEFTESLVKECLQYKHPIVRKWFKDKALIIPGI